MSVIIALSLLSLVFCILFGFVGELALPFASAFLAVLFIFEKPDKRIFSYIIPIIGICFNIVMRGIYMIVSLELVVLALIIALCYRYSETKNICSVYLSVAAFIFLLCSFYVSGARSCGDFSPNTVAKHYSEVYLEFKDALAGIIASIKLTAADGTLNSIMTEQQAKELISEYSKLTVAYIGVASFLIAGISLKVFNFVVLRISKHGIRKTFAYFFPKTWLAYLYAAISIVSAFIDLESTFSIGIRTVSEILMFVFAYIGIRYVMVVARASSRKGFYTAMLVFGLLFMPGIAVQVVSYFGAWIVVSTNLIKPIA
jgi:hypothetical protein